MRLLSSQGELVRGRCRATNLCEYCSRLFAIETSEMLMLDALEHAPTLYAVLTARELLDRADCRAHLRQLRKSLRKRWPAIEWACLVEFQRRGALHLNLLVKGVPVDQADALHAAMSALWCSRVDALPRGQFVGEVNHGAGLVRYVTQHFMKPAQAPPLGWRGHRYSATRGYLVRPASVMRSEAREALRGKRALFHALRAGHQAHDAELVAHQALELAAATTWRLVEHTPTTRTGGPSCTPRISPASDAARPTPCPSSGAPTSSRDRGSASNASKPSARGSHALDTERPTAAGRPPVEQRARPVGDSAPPDRTPAHRTAGQPASARPGAKPRRAPAPDRPAETGRPPDVALPHYRDWLL